MTKYKTYYCTRYNIEKINYIDKYPRQINKIKTENNEPRIRPNIFEYINDSKIAESESAPLDNSGSIKNICNNVPAIVNTADDWIMVALYAGAPAAIIFTIFIPLLKIIKESIDKIEKRRLYRGLVIFQLISLNIEFIFFQKISFIFPILVRNRNEIIINIKCTNIATKISSFKLLPESTRKPYNGAANNIKNLPIVAARTCEEYPSVGNLNLLPIYLCQIKIVSTHNARLRLSDRTI